MIHLLLASSNQHKASEFQELFAGSSLSLEVAPEKLEVLENGSTFFENAHAKAETYFKFYKKPIMADDSGLMVTALPDQLGVQTARFGGENLSDEQRARLLLECLKGNKERQAYFVCVLCFYLSPSEIYFFEGRLDGKIAEDYRGEYGFGYDPVFIPSRREDESTLAEIPQWKAGHSHRFRAVESALKFFRERDCQKN